MCIVLVLGSLALADVPQGVHLGWAINDVHTTMTVAWYTEDSTTATELLFDTVSRGGKPEAYASSVTAYDGPTEIFGREDEGEGFTYKATATGLEPGTSYYFVVGGPDGYTEELKFRTIPSTGEVRFASQGDTRQKPIDWPEGRNTVARLMAEQSPYFMIHIGDIIERGIDPYEWKEYFNHMQADYVTPDGHLIPILPAVGNHEVERTGDPEEGDWTVPLSGFYEYELTMEDSHLYYQFLAVPEPYRWYILDINEDLRIFCLNSETYTNPAYPEGAIQYNWLRTNLEVSKDIPWTVAFYQSPAYSGTGDRVENFLPLFDQFDLDLAICGSAHYYARTFPVNGTVHIVDGGGGGPLSQGSAPSSVHACGPYGDRYSYVIWDWSPTELRNVARNDLNRVIDTFSLREGQAESTQLLLTTRGEDANARDNSGLAPLVRFPTGTYPPIARYGTIGAGGYIAAGLAWSCTWEGWRPGEIDVLFDVMFQQINPGATRVCWYEGYGVAYDTEECSDLVGALRGFGYTVVGDDTEPITADLLSQYDILVIPQLRLGDPGVSGDPSLLPWADVEAIKEFVTVGNGLIVMDCHDYGRYSWSAVNNKILEGIGADVALQSDGVYNWIENWGGRGWQNWVDVDPNTAIGAAYVERTGGTGVGTFEVCTVVPVPPLWLEKVPAGEVTKVYGQRSGAGARVIIETLDEGGYVRMQREPVVEGALTVVGITTDVPRDSVAWPYTVELYYEQEAFDASGIVFESDLALFYWDEEQGMWRACPESGVSTRRNCVTAAAYPHMTRFAIMEK
jgi:hypothetical protein